MLKGFGGHLESGLATPWGRALALAAGRVGPHLWVLVWGHRVGHRLVWVGSTGVVLGLLQSLSHTSLWVSGW